MKIEKELTLIAKKVLDSCHGAHSVVTTSEFKILTIEGEV